MNSSIRKTWPAMGSAEGWAVVVALACFANVPLNDFAFDGVAIVQRNPRITDSQPWSSVWGTDYWAHMAEEIPNRDLLYRPVTLSSFRLVRAVLGEAAWGQHLVNVLLHATVCWAVVRLGRRLLLPGGGCLAAGVLFAVLPIHTEVVANVVGRADLLATLGVLSALLCHHQSLCSADQRGVWAWRMAVMVAVFLAVGSKESAVGVILLVPLFDFFWRRHGSSVTVSTSVRLSRRVVSSVWGSGYVVVPVAAYLLLRYSALGGVLHQKPTVSPIVNLLAEAGPAQRVLGVVQLWGMYWAKMLWPSVLCINYSAPEIRLAGSPADPSVLAGLLAGGGLIAVSLWGWRRGDARPALATAAMLIGYAPTANALVLLQVFFAERIWYLPSLWAVVLLVWVGLQLCGSFIDCKRSPTEEKAQILVTPNDGGVAFARFARAARFHWVGVALGLSLVLVMMNRCWTRNAEWRDNDRLYAAAYRDHPQAIGVLHLYGQWLVNQGERAEGDARSEVVRRGLALLRRAVEIDIGFTDAHRALGRGYLNIQEYDAAMHHLQLANMQAPQHAATIAALRQAGDALARGTSGELANLIAEAETNPRDFDAQMKLIQRLRDLGKYDVAISRLQSSDQHFQDRPDWHHEYAVTLVFAGRLDESIARYRRLVDLEPRADAMIEMAMLMLERRKAGDIEEAWTWQKRAASLAPGSPIVLACEGELHALGGDLKAARACYQRALAALHPDSPLRTAYQQRIKALGN